MFSSHESGNTLGATKGKTRHGGPLLPHKVRASNGRMNFPLFMVYLASKAAGNPFWMPLPPELSVFPGGQC
ncbi:MAG: hypothetical protein CSA81_05435 [Acidobacteria bacterium]|nr:MAG: hypothetical protein CSA81_05435 [Acidobacteriota bacterium]PIE90969.1 MAG: hypothetical protein CR997_03675 [Acidobacteriota bacterium]